MRLAPPAIWPHYGSARAILPGQMETEQMTDSTNTSPRRFLATAAHHEKLARALRACGDDEGAKSATEAAHLCRRNAEEPEVTIGQAPDMFDYLEELGRRWGVAQYDVPEVSR